MAPSGAIQHAVPTLHFRGIVRGFAFVVLRELYVQMSDPYSTTSDLDWELAVESIALRIRWFGLIVGYLLVNVLDPEVSRPYLNGILTLGAVYALFDLIWHWRGEVFLSRTPLFVSLMEALFIGLLCYFDKGIDSPFRYYYFLSLLVCAMRYSPTVTYTTYAMHSISYAMLASFHGELSRGDVVSLVLMLVFMGWGTWAGTALTLLIRETGAKLSRLNHELEERIERRTRELQQSQALLVQQEKQAAFGLLAAGIAHEVGNPLAAISSLVQLMNRKELEPEMHERLGLIDSQLIRIQKTLRELVEFSRPGNNEVKTTNIREVIENALNIAKYYKRKKGKTIRTHFDDDVPPLLIVRDRILQVFLNLILNALDATEEGGVIHIATQRSDAFVSCTFTDDGHGIAAERQSQLFQPYFTTKPTGTGLGLFVSQNIVHSMGGSIELVSSSPGATEFRVTLPISIKRFAIEQGAPISGGIHSKSTR